MTADGKTAVVTGASAGIGAAAARALAREGFRVFLGARRADRIAELAGEIGGGARRLDVNDPESVTAFAGWVREESAAIHLLVNNAGVAFGLDPLADSIDQRWRAMYETNVLGVLRMTRELLGDLESSGDGHVVIVGSTSSFETYPGGSGYTASKHALRALTRTLRQEMFGRPVRVTEICPGLVETEFSRVRFEGDDDRARSVYRGMNPLTAGDVAECIAWAASRPSHVNVDEIVVRPRDQVSSTQVFRRD